MTRVFLFCLSGFVDLGDISTTFLSVDHAPDSTFQLLIRTHLREFLSKETSIVYSLAFVLPFTSNIWLVSDAFFFVTEQERGQTLTRPSR